jgi:hypothetical protein
MSAVTFPSKPEPDGNGAREALIGAMQIIPIAIMDNPEKFTEWLLLELAARGFIVVSIDKAPQ